MSRGPSTWLFLVLCIKVPNTAFLQSIQMSTSQALYASLSGFDSFLEKEVSILQWGSNPVLGVSSCSTWPSRITRRERENTFPHPNHSDTVASLHVLVCQCPGLTWLFWKSTPNSWSSSQPWPWQREQRQWDKQIKSSNCHPTATSGLGFND